ncbi:MAG: FkbM family methyltransferase [Flavobacterium sp.]|nr:MAG: FkbM family methyltransferase [Flavobacterium sp.]
MSYPLRWSNIAFSLKLRYLRLKFASGGYSFADKINSYKLKKAMDGAYRPKKSSINGGEPTSSTYYIRHKKFANLKLKYNLTDRYQMEICKEFFLQNLYDLERIKFIPELIIDCGGFKGYFSILASEKFPNAEIICIEPHPINSVDIEEHLNSNNSKTIKLIPKGISRSKEPIKFFVDGTIGSLDTKLTSEKFHMVETIDLEELIVNDTPLLLKVDVEGAELEFFPTIIDRLPQQCFVFLETHDGWNSLNEIKNKFLLNGFSFELISERGEFIDSIAQRC